MKFIADLHVHSLYSIATSKSSNLQGLYAWAQVKGIHLVGTGDFTHPAWFSQLKEQLEPAEPGFFRLVDHSFTPALADVQPEPIKTRFLLTAEISCIYKKDSKVRKIHNILVVPDFESAEKISTKLAAIGNIESDGRPILGLDARNLLEILLECSPEGFLVPAHIWTPWFSLFGSKSGFDAIEDCFGDLTDHIFALETGLSSDPEMNRLISSLDKYTLISNSDCHSPAKLGREANLFDSGFDFFSMKSALKGTEGSGFLGTIEFYPEEGKYHFDGHRKCNVCLTPAETRQYDFKCPVCQKPLTVGVMHRVMELADRQTPVYPENGKQFESLVPLAEILSEIMKVGSGSKKVQAQYSRLISLFGSEFNLFRNAPLEDIDHKYSEILAEAIRRLRAGQVIRKPGFDGEFGVIKLFTENEIDQLNGQTSFLASQVKKPSPDREQKIARPYPIEKPEASVVSDMATPKGLNNEQTMAVNSLKPRILVSAGPGTGKTYTLVSRLIKKLQESDTKTRLFSVITFTNKAAEEIRQRLHNSVGSPVDQVFVGTFHQFCLRWLREETPGLAVIGPEHRQMILRNLFPDRGEKKISVLSDLIADHFFQTSTETDTDYAQISLDNDLESYRRYLKENNAVDLDAIIPSFVHKLSVEPQFYQKVTRAVQTLLIDEFQDLNLSQYELVKLFAEYCHIFAIGDPNQAIYGFRGCNPRFFQTFTEDFPVEVFELERNYRSTAAILSAAASVIQHNMDSAGPELLPHRKSTAEIQHIEYPNVKLEAEAVARKIDELVGGLSHINIHSRGAVSDQQQVSFKDIAILYRLSDQARTFATIFEGKGIPYQQIDAKPFFMEKELRPLFYWIVCASDSDSAHHLQLLRYVAGVGNHSIRKIERLLPLNYLDFFSATTSLDLSSGIKSRLAELKHNLDDFRDQSQTLGISASLDKALAYLQVEPETSGFDRLRHLATTFGKNLEVFSNHLQQNSAATIYDDRAEAVSLMTLHAAKGLEFPVVFIIGAEEDFLPCNLPGLTSNIEEERRLFYVGVTRAQDQLILTSSKSRTVFGKKRNQIPSRFINEIPADLIRRDSLKLSDKKRVPGQQLSF